MRSYDVKFEIPLLVYDAKTKPEIAFPQETGKAGFVLRVRAETARKALDVAQQRIANSLTATAYGVRP